MKKTKIIFSALLLSVALGPFTGFSQTENALPGLETVEVREAGPENAASLERIENFLNGVKTMAADFVQIGPGGTVTTGTFHLERPGRVRFEYEEDNPILIVSDGTILNFIDYELGQITRWPVEDTPLSLLLEEEIEFGDNVELSARGPGQLANLTTLTAFDPEKPGQGTMTLIFSRENNELMLEAWEVVDAQGALTSVTLRDARLNVELKDSLWAFEDPRNKRFQRRRKR